MNIRSERMCDQHKEIFREEITKRTLCTRTVHKIDTGDNRPRRQYNGRIPIHVDKLVAEEINKLLEHGIISPSRSEWCSRIVPILKENGKIRLCIDYRHINAITVKESYPIPCINDLLDRLSSAKTFSIIDATTGYYQLGLDEDSKQKTAFLYNNIKYEFNRMPFGLCNAPATFQSLMDGIFAGEDRKFVLPYMDDIIVYSRDEDEHEKHLNYVFLKLKGANIYLNRQKCKLFRQELKILGNVISHNRVKPDPDKTSAIYNYNKPTTIREMRAFLGLANQTRQYIPNYAALVSPLNQLLRGQTRRSVKRIIWTEKTEIAFAKTREAIIRITDRAQPNFRKEFILTTDASKDAIGAILSQCSDTGKEKIIYCFSRGMTTAELNYSVTEKELLAVVKGIDYFRHYLIGHKFTLKTDHKALESLTHSTELSPRLMRWALQLQEYNYFPLYIKGECNSADGLSRQVSINAHKMIELNKAEKERIIRDYHLKTGHGSDKNLKYLLKDKWHGIIDTKEIQDYIKKCKTCLKSGGIKTNTRNKILDVNSVNELWEVDLIGPLKCQEGTNKYILMCVDHYSKWTEACLLENKEANTTSKALERVINKNGIPQRILSDCGKEFMNKDIEALTSKYNTKWDYNSPNHHKTMGQVERTNQTLLRKLRKIIDYDTEKWEDAVQRAVTAVNISYHRALKTSPYRFKYGKTYCFETDAEFGITQEELSKETLIKERNKSFRDYAEKEIEKGKISDKRNFKVGDKVLIYREVDKNKLAAKWQDGYIVKRRLEHDSYMVGNGYNTYKLNKGFIKLDTSILEEGVSVSEIRENYRFSLIRDNKEQ